MTTIALPSLAHQQHIVLENISWEAYQGLLNDPEQRPAHLTYDNGRLEIMPPLALHEAWKKHFSRLIETMATQRRIRMKARGQTTFSREDLEKGLEPDECYYLDHADAIRGKARIELPNDPPPDLAIEIDITHSSIARLPIYAALGIPEIWRFDGSKLHVLNLGANKTYEAVSQSKAFPFLPMDQFASFLLRMESVDELETIEEFLVWVKSL